MDNTKSTLAIGANKENLACSYLQAHGLQLIARNVRYRSGELDLVMRDGDYLVFVEVRYRRNSQFGSPAETVVKKKQQRILKAASCYLQQHPSYLACRFDILAITGIGSIEWLQDAFW
ncbi:hypothetical protein TI03_02550 [Achromatium sp. WMS1]|nr:hypothetical protein TI03_02550 [Achromatium sp. WMS1]